MRKALAVGLGFALAAAAAAVAAFGQSTDGEIGGAAGPDRAGEIYAADCQSCHGPRGEGVSGLGPELGTGGGRGAGPPLTDVGPAAIDFYLRTGYMPLDDPSEQPERSEPAYGEAEIAALVDYVDAFGGPGDGEPIPDPEPARGDVAEGQRLFADKCSGCHQIVGSGGIVLEGKAPQLGAASTTEVAEAVRVGPYLMPEFGPEEIDASELDSLTAYVERAQEPRDPGGWGIGHIGPIAEGLVAWIVAAFGLVAVAMLIGRRMRGG